ncbi:hypothetical protein BDA99DRAFT_574952 [Phascolomyces articulosus]|uniref:NmrA-like domain-containing protein n=1 Tax=Phascolomyces articulosus TaxID=60185 RepID=A0AAD5K2W0_9FUNG|nr:hypothetical protein BDA99DRAFT_574952 [Phascolomyces articulosus]
MVSQQEERIYFVGGTGFVGKKAVEDTLDAGIKVTIYTRHPEKSNFSEHPNVTFVQGDYDNITAFEKSIAGHTRLFLLTATYDRVAQIKGAFARLAYAAGVKQIIDISTITIDLSLFTYIAQSHFAGEEAIRDAKNSFFPDDQQLSFVSLRPWRFMSNNSLFYNDSITHRNIITGTADPDIPQGYISPNDIGSLAAIILREPIEKHGDAIYPMTGQLLTASQRAEIASKVLDRPIKYKQWSVKEQYDVLSKALGGIHKAAYDLAQDIRPDFNHSPGLSIVLGREPETLEEWFTKNKDLFRA